MKSTFLRTIALKHTMHFYDDGAIGGRPHNVGGWNDRGR